MARELDPPFLWWNGRTARSVSYLALCAKLDLRLPGRVTIPDLIVNRRNAYIKALRSADQAWANNRVVDVSGMEELMESVMAKQLVSIIRAASGKDDTNDEI